jgi:hypothetical protein
VISVIIFSVIMTSAILLSIICVRFLYAEGHYVVIMLCHRILTIMLSVVMSNCHCGECCGPSHTGVNVIKLFMTLSYEFS